MFKNDLEVVGIATDDKGKSLHDRSQHREPEHEARHREPRAATGFRVIQSLDLAAGPLPAARRPCAKGNTRKAGMVTFDLEVPDFTKAPLTMSGVALTSAMSGAAPTIRPKDPLEKLLPGPLTTLSRVPADRRDRALHRDLRQRQAGRTRRRSSPR